MAECDMVDSQLCVYYRERGECKYGVTHRIEYCPYGLAGKQDEEDSGE